MPAAWTPQVGPQLEAIQAAWCPELFFGGARGGGKSDYLLGDFLQDVPTYGQHWHGVIFRRTYPELEELIKRSKDIYPLTGGEWLEGKKTWTWPSGATLKMRHIENTADAAKYQGHQYTWIAFDELTNWSDLQAYFMLLGCLRSAHGVPCRMRASGNPGGPGHQAVKAYFVDPAPLGFTPIADEETGMERLFIPSKVEDNKYLGDEYVRQLKRVGSDALVAAWLKGDWNVVMGAYFDMFGEKHILPSFMPPMHWLRFRSLDWGYAAPFSVGWWAVSDGGLLTIGGKQRVLPAGALVRYREWYGASGPNKGLKLNVDEVARGIKEHELPSETFGYSVADPAIFATQSGPSIAEQMQKWGISWRPGDNKRKPGWQQVVNRLHGKDGQPMLYVTANCTDTIRTGPALQHDERDPDDVDTNGEDHAWDEIRYACMSRSWVEHKANDNPSQIRTAADITLNELWERQKTEEIERV